MTRHNPRYAACWGLLFLAFGGCGDGVRKEHATEAVRSIAEAEKVTLYSIDSRTELFPEGAERFHTYPVLGKVDITAAGTRDPIVSALRDGIARCRLDSGYNCFWPRHGIRAERGGKAVDYVICFECAQIEVYDDAGAKVNYLLTTGEAQPTFDRQLTAAGVPLAPPRQ